MRSKRTMRLDYQAANCGLCHRSIDFPSGFWFATEDAELGIVHPDCMAYDLERDPVRPGTTMVHTCGDAACVNPAHLVPDLSKAEYEPCDLNGTMENGLVLCCSAPESADYWSDHFHAALDGAPCEHRHEHWQEALDAHGLSRKG